MSKEIEFKPKTLIQKEEIEKTEEVTSEEIESEIQNEYDQISDTLKAVDKAITGATPEEISITTFKAVFELPDDAFEILSSYFKDQFENIIAQPSFRFMLAEVLREEDIEAEEVGGKVVEITDKLTAELGGNLSQIKQDFIKELLMSYANELAKDAAANNQTISIPIEICREGAQVPTYASTGDAGLDIYSLEDYTIAPGETKIIPTGIKVAIPKGFAILIQPRSGQSVKTKLRIANTPGLIDSGYRDEIGVIVENIEPAIADIEYEFVNGDETKINISSILHGSSINIDKGQRFAQMRLVAVPNIVFNEVKSILDFGDNRGGGFGHSGN